jgi:hypothetical protein
MPELILPEEEGRKEERRARKADLRGRKEGRKDINDTSASAAARSINTTSCFVMGETAAANASMEPPWKLGPDISVSAQEGMKGGGGGGWQSEGGKGRKEKGEGKREERKQGKDGRWRKKEGEGRKKEGRWRKKEVKRK